MLQNIPEINKQVQNKLIVFICSIFLAIYFNIKIIATKEKVIKNTFEPSKILKAAPVFLIKISSNIGFGGNLSMFESIKLDKFMSRRINNVIQIKI